MNKTQVQPNVHVPRRWVSYFDAAFIMADCETSSDLWAMCAISIIMSSTWELELFGMKIASVS